MKKFITAVLFVILSASTQLFAGEITVSNIATKIVEGPNSSGDIHYAIKADVTNSGQNNQVSVKLQGIDGDGFELEDLYLSGDIAPGETKTLTDKRIMAEKDYNNIKDWRTAE